MAITEISAGVAMFTLVVLFLVAIVYGRVRAETGVAMVWVFAEGQQDKVIADFLGQKPIVGSGRNYNSPAMFAMTRFLANG